MKETRKITRAWVKVNVAREDFISAQDAVLELTQMGDTEAARLDSEEFLAQKLCESLGGTDISGPASRTIFDAVAQFVETTRAVRTVTISTASIENPESGSHPVSETQVSPDVAGGGEATADEVAEAEAQAEADAEAEAEAAFTVEIEALNDVLVSKGLSRSAIFRALNRYWKLERRGLRADLLRESLLISAVSQFETFIARLIAESLHFSPQLLNESGRNFAYHEVSKHADLDAFFESAAEDYADRLMRGPMNDWLKFLSTSLRQDTLWVDDYLNEIMQRRHIHVHAGGRVSAQYIENTRKGGALKIGKRLPVSADYLQVALDRLAVVVLVISQASLAAIRASKLAKRVGFDADDGKINEIAFELLIEGRPGAVAEIIERVDASVWTNSTREHLRANSWLAMKMLGRLDEIRRDVEDWDVSLSERLSLAKACLLETPEAKSILDRLMAAGEISVLDAAIWPLLEPLRRTQVEQSLALTAPGIESRSPEESL